MIKGHPRVYNLVGKKKQHTELYKTFTKKIIIRAN